MRSRDRFNEEEQAYLRSLAAVSRVTATRITYTTAFREECMRRYWQGESGVQIFRESGLGPEVIGYKRIERCIARWRGDRPPVESHAHMHRIMVPDTTSEGADAASLHHRIVEDERIIVLQVRRIQELEDQIARMRAELRDTPNDADEALGAAGHAAEDSATSAVPAAAQPLAEA